FVEDSVFFTAEWANNLCTGVATPTWTADNVQLTSGGKLSGEIVTRDASPRPELAIRADVLFIQPAAVYFASSSGATTRVDVGAVLPSVASTASTDSARFTLDQVLTLPKVLSEERKAIAYIQFKLSWVRVYESGNALYFKVALGSGNSENKAA